MNREIKFRAWSIEDKKMYSIRSLCNCDTRPIGTCYELFGEGLNHTLCNHDKEQYILMQYVGLKDNNGNEVFEGDVIMADGCIGEVYYTPCEFNVSLINDRAYAIPDCFDNFNESGGVNVHTGRCEWFRIIGNIYENKELIDKLE